MSQLNQKTYIVSTNRFYHTYYLSHANPTRNELNELRRTALSHKDDPKHNHEQNHLSFDRVFTLLDDTSRGQLLARCKDLLGFHFEIVPEIPNNSFSRNILHVDGIPLSLASTGVRLLVLLLACCYYHEFEYLLIDEPELSLSPPLQSVLKDSFSDLRLRENSFPHLKHIVVATHSHLFLNRNLYTDNYRVDRTDKTVSVRAVETVQDYLDIQFNLLGNDLESMFLPAAIVLVEGPSDQMFIKSTTRCLFPDRNIAVINATGDGGVLNKLRILEETFGELNASPYTSRIFVVTDSVSSLNKDKVVKKGIAENHFIQWPKNGIEYYYPPSIVAEIYKCDASQLTSIIIDESNVSLCGHKHSKTELAKLIAEKLKPDTQHEATFKNFFIDRMARAVAK